jgi:phage-related minor tail protein
MQADATELDTLVIRVRADTAGFMAGVGDIRRELDGPLAQGVDRAGSGIERALARAAVTGKFGFEDLRRVALSALADIAAGALRTDIGSLFGGGSSGLAGALTSSIGSLFGGVPGRATGGPVTSGSAYLVGERGPELFVPTAAGRVETMAVGRHGPVSVTINVAAARDATPALMQQTGTQVARAVRQALQRAGA